MPLSSSPKLVPAVIHWARGPMAELFVGSLEDPPVGIREADISDTKTVQAGDAYDAILLDVTTMTGTACRAGAGDRLYHRHAGPLSARARRRSRRRAAPSGRRTRPGGFAARRTQSGFEVEESPHAAPRQRGAPKSRHLFGGAAIVPVHVGHARHRVFGMFALGGACWRRLYSNQPYPWNSGSPSPSPPRFCRTYAPLLQKTPQAAPWAPTKRDLRALRLRLSDRHPDRQLCCIGAWAAHAACGSTCAVPRYGWCIGGLGADRSHLHHSIHTLFRSATLPSAPPIRAPSRRRRHYSAWCSSARRVTSGTLIRHRDQRRRRHADLSRAYPGQRAQRW